MASLETLLADFKAMAEALEAVSLTSKGYPRADIPEVVHEVLDRPGVKAALLKDQP